MNLIERFFENNRHHFEGPEGRFKWFYPFFEVIESFFILTGRRTPAAPHVRDAIGLKRYMSAVLIALLPPYLFGLALFGPHLLLMTIVSYVVGLLIELVFALVRQEEFSEGFFVTGLLFPMILPPATPLWMVALGVGFGVFFGKEVFGGTGHNIFNPALVGRCFLSLAWPGILAEAYITPFGWLKSSWWGLFRPSVDVITTATPLGNIKEVITADGSFPLFSTETIKYWIGLCPGSACETSAVLILISGIFLCWTRVANWRVPVTIIVTYVVMAFVLSRGGLWPHKFVGPVAGLGAGGLLFGAMYMATDPVTSPLTSWGKVLYGVGIAVMVVLVRGLGAVPEGVTYAILIMNIFAPLIDKSIMQANVPKPLPREEVTL